MNLNDMKAISPFLAARYERFAGLRLLIIERLRFTFTPNSKREFVPRDQVFPLFFVYCLLILPENKYFYASFIHKNRSGLFLSAYFLF